MCAAFNTSPISNSDQSSARPPDEVRGTLERITFHNEDNGYTVARLLPEGARDVVTITGNFTGPVVGEMLVCYGAWTRHPQWGRQMQVQKYETVRPATAHAIEKYLGSGMVKGVGPVTAKRIVAKFGEDALDIIEKTPRKLLQVQGIGEKMLKTIKDAWKEQSEIRNIMLFLQGHGISPAYAIKIYKTYQERSIAIVEKNPYQLATDIWGIGFKSADKIARNLGFAEDDPRRLEAGVVYVLNESVDTGGNAFLTREELVKASAEILGPFDITDALNDLTSAGRLVLEESSLLGATETAIYTPSLYNTERSLAQRLKDFAARPVKVALDTPKAQEWLAQTLEKNDLPLTDEQQGAVRMTLQGRVSVITGGPGVGKTFTTRAVVAAFKGRGKRVLLASPTGRAAKRLSEMTGAEASTIHRMLSFDPSKRQFLYDADNPLECDVLLVDEASMLDMVLAYSLLKAVPDMAQVIFVGDVDQLPSVGPGNVLRDMIDSGIVPVTRLTQVFRQAAQSGIIKGAHAVNAGKLPVLSSPKDPGADFVYIPAEEAEDVAEKIVAIVAKSLPKRGYSPGDIQVLSPMQRGSAGAAHLNQRLQEVLNPPSPDKPEVQRAGRLFRVGDRVIQLKNNYDKLVFNGDIGVVIDIVHEDSTLIARFAETEVAYDFSDLDELNLARVVSIHKSQGSEFPVAVIALHTQHYALLQRNLVYTALTRAKKLAVLVGNMKALAMAVKNDKQAERHTRLKERLQGLI